jgi:hypothetical protein
MVVAATLIATAAADGQITIRDGDTFEPIREMVGAIGTGNSWADGALLLSGWFQLTAARTFVVEQSAS